MAGTLEELLSRLREDMTLFSSTEEATRQGVILPILSRLGWDRDNVREVAPEFAVGGGRVDYCLRIGEKNAAFIEVKRTREDLEQSQHQEQLLNYAFRVGVAIAVLTNGLSWWFYLPLSSGSWDERKFFTIDIQQQEVAAVAEHFREFLGREGVATASAVERAKSLRESKEKAALVKATIPKAWNRLCQDPDELLLELLAEKVERLCGLRPDPDVLEEFLLGAARAGDTAPPVQPLPQRRAPVQAGQPSQAPLQGVYTNKKPRGFTFKGQHQSVSTFKEILIGLCRILYHAQGSDFRRVLTLKGRKRAYFSEDFKEMTSPEKIPDAEIYVETNLSANMIMDRCGELLELFGYSRAQFQVEVEDR